MLAEESELGSLSDIELRGGTFLTAAGFYGLALDPISAVVAVVGFFDWIETLRDDAAQANLRNALRSKLVHFKADLESLQAEVRQRSGKNAK